MSESNFDPAGGTPEAASEVVLGSVDTLDAAGRGDAPDVSDDDSPDAPDTPGTPEAAKSLEAADTEVEDRDATLVDAKAKLETDAPVRESQESFDKRDPEALERAREYLREHGRGLSRGGLSK